MKKTYESPTIEIEEYTLDMSIASNCTVVVNNGPATDTMPQCSNYVDIDEPGPDEFSYSTFSAKHTSFYEDRNVCDCYYSAGGNGYWTS